MTPNQGATLCAVGRTLLAGVHRSGIVKMEPASPKVSGSAPVAGEGGSQDHRVTITGHALRRITGHALRSTGINYTATKISESQ